MAVTQTADRKSESPKQLEPHAKKLPMLAIVESSTCVNLRKPASNLNSCSVKGASTGHPKINKNIYGIAKKFQLRRFGVKNNASDDLSDIDDVELVGYFNTKEEMRYKRILWEAMNGKSVNAKKRKISTETENGASLKKASETTEKVKLQGRSSRINYEALKIHNEQLEQGSQVCGINSSDSPNQKVSPKTQGSNDFLLDSSYRKDEETWDQNINLYNECGDEYFNDFD